jgi:hypothetical protein
MESFVFPKSSFAAAMRLIIVRLTYDPEKRLLAPVAGKWRSRRWRFSVMLNLWSA